MPPNDASQLPRFYEWHQWHPSGAFDKSFNIVVITRIPVKMTPLCLKFNAENFYALWTDSWCALLHVAIRCYGLTVRRCIKDRRIILRRRISRKGCDTTMLNYLSNAPLERTKKGQNEAKTTIVSSKMVVFGHVTATGATGVDCSLVKSRFYSLQYLTHITTYRVFTFLLADLQEYLTIQINSRIDFLLNALRIFAIRKIIGKFPRSISTLYNQVAWE